MAKTILTQYDETAKTQNVLYYDDGSVLRHSARFPANAWDSLINSVLDWTRDGEFHAGMSDQDVTLAPLPIGSLVDFHA